YEAEKHALFGYLFRRAKLAKLDAEFQQDFILSVTNPPHEILGLLTSAAATLTEIKAVVETIAPCQGVLAAVHAYLTNEDFASALRFLASIAADYEYLRAQVASLPKTLAKLKINFASAR